MQKQRKTSPSPPEYWEKRYFDVTNQLAKLREEYTREVAQKDATIQALQRENDRLRSLLASRSEVDFSNSRILDLASSVCGSSQVSALGLSYTLRETGVFGPTKRIQQVQSATESDVTFAITEGSEDRPIYEEFFLLGLSEPQDNCSVASVLYQYPGFEYRPESLTHKVIPEFCYPLGCVAYPLHLSQSGTALNELIYGRESLYRSTHFYVFTLKANNSVSVCADWEKANKDKDVLYCVCLSTDDLVATERGHFIYPKCLCLVSYFPCFELHFQVLASLLSMKRIRRMSVSPGCTLTQSALDLMACRDITDDEVALLSSYHSTSPPRTGLAITIPVSIGNDIEYIYPDESALDTACLGMQALMRPFTWPHVVVPLLPSGLIEVLEAPVPILVGTPPVPGLDIQKFPELIWVVLSASGKGATVVCGKQGLRQSVKEPDANSLKAKIKRHYANIGDIENCFIWEDRQLREVLTIAKLCRCYWTEVAALIPKSPEMVGRAFLDLQSLQQSVLLAAPKADHNFLSLFTNSQIFVLHVEERMKTQQVEKTRH